MTDSGNLLDKLELKCDKGQGIVPKDANKPELSIRQKLQVRKMFARQLANMLREQCQALLEFNLLSDKTERKKNIIDNKALQKYIVQFEAMSNCSSRIEVENGEIAKVFRCKNKFCPICNANKQGELINKYTPFFKKNKGNLYFVTLTQNTVSEHELNATYKFQKKTMSCIRRSMNRYKDRNGLPKLQGITKGETTYSPSDYWYHAHQHIVIVGKENAERLLSEWVRKAREYGYKVSDKGQDIQPCTSLKDLFKYVTKLSYAVSKKDKLQKVYTKPLLNIYHSLQGIQSIRHFGLNTDELNAKREYEAEPDKSLNVGESSSDVYEWNLNRLDYHSFKSNRSWGNMNLKDWSKDRFSTTDYDDMFSDETKNMVNRARGKPIAKQLTVSTLF